MARTPSNALDQLFESVRTRRDPCLGRSRAYCASWTPSSRPQRVADSVIDPKIATIGQYAFPILVKIEAQDRVRSAGLYLGVEGVGVEGWIGEQQHDDVSSWEEPPCSIGLEAPSLVSARLQIF